MNFLPEDYVEKRQAARAAVVFIGLLLLVVGGVVGTYLFTQQSMKGIFAERDRVNAAYEDAAKKIAEAEALEKQEEEMVRKAEITTTLMERVKRSALLSALAAMRPQGVTFVLIDLKSKEIAPLPGSQPNSDLNKAANLQAGKVEIPKPPQMDVTIILTGTAPTDAEVAAYMAKLQKSEILTGVALMYSEQFKKEKDGPELRKFSIEMHLNPEADLRVTASAAIEK
jgi:hypothetical protein